MIKIVLSYEDNYIDRVEKIKEEFFDDVDYFYVEDYINKNILLDFTNNDIIYILNNSTYNLQLIKEIKDKVYKESPIMIFTIILGATFIYCGLSFLLSKTIYNVCQLTSIIKIVVVPIINSLIGILVYKIFKKPILSLEEE